MELSFEDVKLRNRKDIDGTPRLLHKGWKGREGSGHTWWVIVADEEVAKWGGVRPAVGGGAWVRRRPPVEVRGGRPPVETLVRRAGAGRGHGSGRRRRRGSLTASEEKR